MVLALTFFGKIQKKVNAVFKKRLYWTHAMLSPTSVGALYWSPDQAV
jgi:hypothetical protein